MARVLPVFPLPRVTFDLLVFHKIIVLHSKMMHDVSLSQMPYSSPFSQNGFHRTNNKMFILRFYARPWTGPEWTENLSMWMSCSPVTLLFSESILRESETGTWAGQISSYHTHLMILAICSISSSRPLFVLCYGRVSRQSQTQLALPL